MANGRLHVTLPDGKKVSLEEAGDNESPLDSTNLRARRPKASPPRTSICPCPRSDWRRL